MFRVILQFFLPQKVRVNVYPLVFNGCVWKSTYLPHKTCRCRTKTLDVWSRPLYKRDLNLFLNNSDLMPCAKLARNVLVRRWQQRRRRKMTQFSRLSSPDKSRQNVGAFFSSNALTRSCFRHASYFTFLHPFFQDATADLFFTIVHRIVLLLLFHSCQEGCQKTFPLILFSFKQC